MAKTPPTKSLTTLWMVLSVLIVLFGTEILRETQGLQIVFGAENPISVNLLEGLQEPVAALWGAGVLAVLLIPSFRLIRLHAQSGGADWRHRFPLRLLQFSPDDSVGRTAVHVGLFFFVLVPLYLWGHSVKVLHNEARLCTRDPVDREEWVEISETGWALWQSVPNVPWRDVLDDAVRLAESCEAHDGTATFFPVIMPVLLTLLSAWMLFEMLRAFRALFWGPRF